MCFCYTLIIRRSLVSYRASPSVNDDELTIYCSSCNCCSILNRDSLFTIGIPSGILLVELDENLVQIGKLSVESEVYLINLR